MSSSPPGWLGAEHLPGGLRNPILLPAKHVVTRLLIEQEDRLCRHAVGPQHLLSNLRQKYWIVKGLSSVKAVRKACVICRRHWERPAPKMGPLPTARTAGSQKPFSRVGIDFAGPYLTKQGRGKAKAKRYVCLFTCLEIRAVHVELAFSMDTDSFLMCFTRFVKRRGVPYEVVTDNGTNFTAGERELRMAVQALSEEKLRKYFNGLRTNWRFNPPPPQNTPLWGRFRGDGERHQACLDSNIGQLLGE